MTIYHLFTIKRTTFCSKRCNGIVAMKKMTEIKGHGMMELFKPNAFLSGSFQLTFTYLYRKFYKKYFMKPIKIFLFLSGDNLFNIKYLHFLYIFNALAEGPWR